MMDSLCTAADFFEGRGGCTQAKLWKVYNNVAFREKKLPLSKRKETVLLHLEINSFQISSSEQFFPCIAVIWIKDPLLHEVSVAGLRQGVTKKNLSSSKARYMVFPFYYIVVIIL